MQLELGLPVIQSYKRLSYTAWHAIAELVDNATQSYFDHRETLDRVFSDCGDNLYIAIAYDPQLNMLRVSDNAMGMSHDELTRALKVGYPPENTGGRSKYGMGMKTASCWLGDQWTLRTKKLGETCEHSVTIDVNRIAGGNNDLDYHPIGGRSADDHYTVIEITALNQVFRGRTIGKIKDFLRSMYRQDLRNGGVTIDWQGTPLRWDDSIFQFLSAPDGTTYRKDIQFCAAGKNVKGWVGVLSKGSRANAGFSIFHADRVVRGWPDSWRPEGIFGFQGRNDLINQRLVGEIHLDEFDVSHTKDDILWHGEEQDKVETALEGACTDYVSVARKYRKKDDAQGGPSDIEVQGAIDALQDQLRSNDFSDIVTLDIVPPPTTVAQALQPLKDTVGSRTPAFQARLEQASFDILGFLMDDASANDPYVVVEATSGSRVLIIVNTLHPHWSQLVGTEGVLNYLRHCTYDGIAEWWARRQSASLDPDTIKILKDRMLRLSLEIETLT